MIGNIGGKTLDVAFRRVRDLDVSMHEQLRTFAETTRRERPEFAAAVDRLVERLRRYGAGESAPQIGEPMPPFVLPDHTSQMVSLEGRGRLLVPVHHRLRLLGIARVAFDHEDSLRSREFIISWLTPTPHATAV